MTIDREDYMVNAMLELEMQQAKALSEALRIVFETEKKPTSVDNIKWKNKMYVERLEEKYHAKNF